MTQQHTIVAKERSVSERTNRELTDIYHQVQHPPMFMGSVKEMVATNEEVPNEPPEITLPALTAQDVFTRVIKLLTDAWDVTATRDRTNMSAQADIVVDGHTLAHDIPVSTLLSLEKQLVNMRTVIKAMPVRDPSKLWAFDADQGFHRAPERRTVKTRKVMKALVLVQPTKEHPARAESYPSDEPVGHYVTTEFSGAFSAQDRQSLVDRLNTLIDAVKTARSEANRTEVTDVHMGAELLGFIFAR